VARQTINLTAGDEWPEQQGPGEGEPQHRDGVASQWHTHRLPDGSTELVGPGYPASEDSVLIVGPGEVANLVAQAHRDTGSQLGG
jgi:hypothetical protein